MSETHLHELAQFTEPRVTVAFRHSKLMGASAVPDSIPDKPIIVREDEDFPHPRPKIGECRTSGDRM